MPPIVILIRHGEAEHNATSDWSLPDPPLTAKGEQQCRDLAQYLKTEFPLTEKIEAIISSPFVRTLQTTLIGLGFLVDKGIKLEVDALWQENSAKPCDTGSHMSELRAKFPEIDFTDLDPVYPSKKESTIYAFTKRAVLARGQRCLVNLYQRPEGVVAVVSHSAFLRTAVSQRQYANADFRVFEFQGTPEGEDLKLVETEATEGTGGMGLSPPGESPVVGKDFPPEKQIEVIKKAQGAKTNGEATEEVP